MLAESRSGTYVCSRCRAKLFSSLDKQLGADDYPTFRAPIDDRALEEYASYTAEGAVQTRLRCRSCRAEIGFIGDIELRSADDLEEGERQREYKVWSRALRFVGSWSGWTRPLRLLVLAAVIGAVVYAGAYGASLVQNFMGGSDGREIELWLDGRDVQATLVRLDRSGQGSMPNVESGTLLFVIPPGSAGVRVRLASGPFEVLWLDERFMTLGFETHDAAASADVLTTPETARYALIATPGVIPRTVRLPGFEVFVRNKADLL